MKKGTYNTLIFTMVAVGFVLIGGSIYYLLSMHRQKAPLQTEVHSADVSHPTTAITAPSISSEPRLKKDAPAPSDVEKEPSSSVREQKELSHPPLTGQRSEADGETGSAGGSANPQGQTQQQTDLQKEASEKTQALWAQMTKEMQEIEAQIREIDKLLESDNPNVPRRELLQKHRELREKHQEIHRKYSQLISEIPGVTIINESSNP